MTKFATVNHDFHHDWTKAFGVHRTEQESLTKLRDCGVTESRLGAASSGLCTGM